MKFNSDSKKVLEELADTKNYYNWILDSFSNYLGENLLEVGAGNGNFLKATLDRFKFSSALALEPDLELFKDLKNNTKRYSSLKILPNFSSDLEKSLVSGIDTIIYNNVLEHIQDDQKELSIAFNLLKKGGHILTFSPAMPSLYSQFDISVGHYRRYTLQEMKQKMLKAGFEIKQAYYFDFVGSLVWYLKFKIFKSYNLNSAQALNYDKFAVPFLRKFEPSKILPFGKNIVVIGQKI
jgi:SAM-dependent methyltransferase